MTPFDEIKTILDRIAATGVHTEADRTALLSALRVDGRGNVVVEIGKYNVSIGQGQDIQIGDRITYEGSDAEAIRQTIHQMLEEYRLRPGIPFQAPPLLEYFVPRPEVTDGLKARLLADRSATTPGILVVSAIHGLGGIGKSTLAAALAHDPEVRQRFSDGILWATLSPELDLLSLLTGWIQEIRDDYNVAPITLKAAADLLNKVLQDKAVLLVVDDIWDPEHAKLFRLGGPQCQVLITTREALIAKVVDAELYDLDVMSPTQALTLLSKRLGRELEATEQEEEITTLAKTVEYLPLALELAAAQVADGIPWSELLSDLQAEVARLETLDLLEPGEMTDEATRKRLSLRASFNLSLGRLPEDKRQQFAWLGVLPENTILTPVMASTLWNTDIRQARKTLRYLYRKALLSSGAALPNGARTYRLHNLLHAQARYLLQAPVVPTQPNDLPGLGLDLSSAHSQVLERYRKHIKDDLWHTLPDDGYIYTYLAWHMAQAGQLAELKRLLFDFNWLQAKLAATDINALMTDYDRLPDDPEAGLVQGALRLGAYILAQNPSQLWNQLYGRLKLKDSAVIKTLIDHPPDPASLRLLTPSLMPPGGPLLRTLSGHTGVVYAVAVTPDGRQAISGSGDKTLKVWDLESGVDVLTLRGHTSYVYAVAVMPDGRRVLSGADDGTVKMWDLESKEEVLTLRGHGHGVTTIAVMPDRRQVLSGSWGRTVKVWDLETGAELLNLSGHGAWVKTVAVTPDGRWAISGADDGMLKVWDLTNGTERWSFRGHTGTVDAVAVTPDGQQVLSGSADGTLKVWDLTNGAETLSLSGHMNSIHAVAVMPDGRRVLSGSGDRTVKVWDLESGTELLSFSGHTGTIWTVAATPDGRQALSGSADGTLKVWDLTNGAETLNPSGHTGAVTAAAVTPDGRRALSGSADGMLKVWDLANGAELLSLSGHKGTIETIAATPDGQRALSGSGEDRTVKVWDLESGTELLSLSGHAGTVTTVAATPDRWRAIMVEIVDYETLKVWDLKTGLEVATLSGHGIGQVLAVAMTPDGRQLILGSTRTLTVWDLETSQEVATLYGHRAWFMVIAVAPNGRQVISGAVGEALIVWDLETGQEVATLWGHGTEVSVVAVTPDGRRALSGSWDGRLKMWDLASGEIIASFNGESRISACAVAPDGVTIVVGEASGRVHFLRLET